MDTIKNITPQFSPTTAESSTNPADSPYNIQKRLQGSFKNPEHSNSNEAISLETNDVDILLRKGSEIVPTLQNVEYGADDDDDDDLEVSDDAHRTYTIDENHSLLLKKYSQEDIYMKLSENWANRKIEEKSTTSRASPFHTSSSIGDLVANNSNNTEDSVEVTKYHDDMPTESLNIMLNTMQVLCS